MQKLYKYLMIISFLSIIFFGGIMTLTKKQVLVSAVENRNLTPKPVVTKEGLVSGTLFSDFDSYFRDQFIGRSKWIKTSSKLDLALGKKRFVDVVRGKDGWLLTFNPFNPTLEEKKLQEDVDYSVNEMKLLQQHIEKNGGTFVFAGIPAQSYFNADNYLGYLDNNLYYYNTLDKMFFGGLSNSGVNGINMKDTFSEYDGQLYYKTDHHYNFRGAQLTYSTIINNLKSKGVNIDKPYSVEDFNPRKINKPFQGSWNAKMNWLYKSDDFVELPNPKFKTPAYKKFVNGKEDNRLYYYNDKDKNVSYAAFMNGDKAETVIRTNRKELPKALIFGDSFTNGVEPMLFLHFDETRILDLRYYKEKSLYSYIEEYKPEVVIFIMGSTVYAFREGNSDFRGVTLEKK